MELVHVTSSDFIYQITQWKMKFAFDFVIISKKSEKNGWEIQMHITASFQRHECGGS